MGPAWGSNYPESVSIGHLEPAAEMGRRDYFPEGNHIHESVTMLVHCKYSPQSRSSSKCVIVTRVGEWLLLDMDLLVALTIQVSFCLRAASSNVVIVVCVCVCETLYSYAVVAVDSKM